MLDEFERARKLGKLNSQTLSQMTGSHIREQYDDT